MTSTPGDQLLVLTAWLTTLIRSSLCFLYSGSTDRFHRLHGIRTTTPIFHHGPVSRPNTSRQRSRQPETSPPRRLLEARTKLSMRHCMASSTPRCVAISTSSNAYPSKIKLPLQWQAARASVLRPVLRYWTPEVLRRSKAIAGYQGQATAKELSKLLEDMDEHGPTFEKFTLLPAQLRLQVYGYHIAYEKERLDAHKLRVPATMSRFRRRPTIGKRLPCPQSGLPPDLVAAFQAPHANHIGRTHTREATHRPFWP